MGSKICGFRVAGRELKFGIGIHSAQHVTRNPERYSESSSPTLHFLSLDIIQRPIIAQIFHLNAVFVAG
jgi:hypothetical protein